TLALTLTDAVKLNSIDISGLKGITGDVAINLANVKHTDNKLVVDIQGSDAAETITANTIDSTITAIKLSGDLGGGANTVTVAPTSGATGIKTIDLSGLSATGGTLTSTITHDAAQTVLTTIIGSVGDDTITIGKANAGLTVTGGAGNDTFNLTASTVSGATAADFTTITDFSTGDSIKFAADSVAGYANVGTVTDSTLAAAITTALALTAGTISVADQAKSVYGFKWEYNGTTETYLFYNAANSSTSATTSDIVVKLSGNVDLDSISLDGATGVTIA
ncbi:hypothetical protein CFT12S02225_04200, partial [Campylobacter fetus subsp. testudinum]